jgi:hypothetical protein
MKTKEFRILEYKNHFEVEQKHIEWFKIFGIPIKKNVLWHKHLIKKDNEIIGFEVRKFDCKKDALDYIEEKTKYPIYHYVKK